MAISRLESDVGLQELQYIFTVDIFNEGVDIPKVNQVIMLRPTQSAIVFVQQMGRGLRKAYGKEYLTIIDFIGNYNNNFLVPIALYGDNSYNKDKLRKLIKSGSASLPGTSTINFDKITKDRIFSAIDAANMRRVVELRNDYKLLKYQLGRAPLMQDFLDHESRDPFLYVEHSKSFFNFAEKQEESLQGALNSKEKKLLEAFSLEINNAKRIVEPLILKRLMNAGSVDLSNIGDVLGDGSEHLDAQVISSAINNLDLKFVRANIGGALIPLNEAYNIQVTEKEANILKLHPELIIMFQNNIFKKYMVDSTEYAIRTFNLAFRESKFRSGFQLYQKYSRKDVFRILCWETNPVAQNVGGYIIGQNKTNCPIFVTYHKAEDIAESTRYEDYFIDSSTFCWMSKSNRTLESKDVQAIRNHRQHDMRLPLFIKKTNDEGKDFYYVGDVEPIVGSFEQTTIRNDAGNDLPVVKLKFRLTDPLEDSIYTYFTDD